MDGFDGSVVAITGGTKGIGEATAHKFAARGATVSICARTPDDLEDVADEIERTHGVECATVPADLTDPEQAAAFVDSTVDRFGHIDVLVNNASSTGHGRLDELTMEEWEHAINSKLLNYISCCKAALPHLIERDGAIVNVAGNSGITAYPDVTSSNVTDAAVIRLTDSLAKDFGGEGVRVNVACPGQVDTAKLRRSERRLAEKRGETWEDIRAKGRTNRSMGRIGTPEELANVIVFLASDEASYVNGATIAVDGGQIRYELE